MKPRIFELSAVDMTLYKFVLPLMKELRNNGFEVYCGARDFGDLERIKNEGFNTYDIAMSRSLNPLALVGSFFQLVKIFKREHIDIVHVHTPVASIAGRLAAFVAGVGIKIYTVHGFILKPRIYYLIEKFMARFFTDYIFTVNREDMDLAIAKRFITRDKILNINSVGIDTSHFDPDLGLDAVKEQLRESLNIKEDERVIGYVGRIAKSKGLLDLVHAYMNVRKEYDCKLLLVGPWDLNERADDAVIEEIGHLIEANDMGDDVLLPGYRHDIAELLSIMDIFVLPSYREGMPVSLLEAMAMEKAVIGTNIRGVKEEITAESGLIYDPGDVGELVKCIKFYMDNEDKASLMGKNARQRVVDYFSQEQVLGRQMKVFLEYQHVIGTDKG